MSTLAERRAAFRALHQDGCFVIPNPWDGGSALRLAKHGFKALASTSAGAAWALGKGDGEMTLDEVLAHLTFLTAVTDLPVNADFEAGFSDTAEGVGEAVARCVQTGVAGLSIEDRDGKALFDEDQAVARIAAARAAIDASGQDVMLTARCEAYLLGKPDIGLVVERLQAYAEAGADCVYAPGIKDLGSVAKIVQGVNRPVNANLTGTGLTISHFAKIGVRRVSVGAALARATYATLDGYASLLANEGRLP